MPRISHTFPAAFIFVVALPISLLVIALCGCGAAGIHADVTTAPNNAAPHLRAADGSSAIVPGRYIVVYRDVSIPAASTPGIDLIQSLPTLGLSVQQTTSTDDQATLATLSAQPNVQYVLHDRYMEGHQIGTTGTPGPTPPPSTPATDASDNFYRSPQGWAVQQAGGFGGNIPGAPATGPWTTTMGRGIRIAILDSGVDANHPDIAPNLALNLSEIDQTSLPSACDDGTPQDQQGHGTWTASLATGAAGANTGGVIGVAPQATLLNIKVLQRIPASDGVNLAAQCKAGQTGGLLSWVLKGINDAIANKADIISFSLGSVVDLNSGDGAGWKASFDRVTHAASNAGIVLVAAVGNDGLDLSASHYIELPAQARDVLPVTASTNPACAETLTAASPCAAGAITRPYYSNYGADLNAIAAPGGSFPNSSDTGTNGWVRGACSTSGCFALGNTPYAQAMGTSASAPLVAGAAALVRAAHPAWTAPQVIAALRVSATHTTTMTEPQLNTDAALIAQ